MATNLTKVQERAWHDKVVMLYRQAKAAHLLAVEEERRYRLYIVSKYGIHAQGREQDREV